MIRNLLIVLFLALAPLAAAAQAVTLAGPAEAIGIGNQITVRVWLKTEGESANAAEGRIRIPEGMTVDQVDTAGSAFALWTVLPSYAVSDGVVAFSGGVPGGLPPEHEALLFTIRAHAARIGSYALIPEGVRIYANDGNGSLLPGTAMRATVTVDEASPVVEVPRTPAAGHPLAVDIGRDDALFGGRYFAAFYGGDAESAVAHYEIREGWFGAKENAERYYVMRDQTLKTGIRVTAVRLDGSRTSMRLGPWYPWYGPYMLVLAFLLALGTWFIRRHLRP